MIEPYNLLAWLRPDAEEVLALRREAIYWLETNAGAGYSSLPGYQLAYPDGTDEHLPPYCRPWPYKVRSAIFGVRYNMGPYSFGGSQRVLTPTAVIQSRSGICIETALLMASALQSAQMHAMIIITPGHAQVALETWENSGTYYLLETTMLPYNATEEETMAFARFLTADRMAGVSLRRRRICDRLRPCADARHPWACLSGRMTKAFRRGRALKSD